MCDRALLILAVAWLSAGTAGEVVGQQPPPQADVEASRDLAPAGGRAPEALQARLDSLGPLVQEARRAMEEREARLEEARRAAAASRARVDTSSFGGATLLTPVDQAEVTREIFSSAWEEHYAHLGPSPALARSTFVLQWTDEPVTIHVDGEARRVVLGRWTRRSRVEEAARHMIGVAMSDDLGARATEVGGWLRGNPLAAVSMEEVFRRVATTSSRTTRACLAGDAAACGRAMGLGTERTVEQLESWYTPAERRALVASTIQEGTRRWEVGRRACLREGTGCEALMIRDPYRDWAPLDTEVRVSLVALALETGGEGAWARLVEEPDMTPSEALAHASGVPLEDLLDSWQARLVEHRPETFEDLVPGSGRTLLWTLFFAGMALRSTRWRLG